MIKLNYHNPKVRVASAIATVVLMALAWYGVMSLVSAWIATAQEEPWTEQELALAQLCWNEGSASRNDCVAITQARGWMELDALKQRHRRTYNPNRTNRRYIAFLRLDLEMPEHWNDEAMRWDPTGRSIQEQLLRTVRATLRGQLRACSERPVNWGGRTTDQIQLAYVMTHGGREVCPGTVGNLFYVFDQ